jgi:hypothetical protein
MSPHLVYDQLPFFTVQAAWEKCRNMTRTLQGRGPFSAFACDFRLTCATLLTHGRG